MDKRSQERGFTLVEVLIVLALVVVVGKFALTTSMDSYRRATAHTDRSYLVAALEHARALAANDVCEGDLCTGGAPHGVYMRDDSYVIFQGTSYDDRDPAFDQIVDADPLADRSGLSEIIFAPGSGDVASPGDIILTDASGRTSTTTIGAYGQIVWTN